MNTPKKQIYKIEEPQIMTEYPKGCIMDVKSSMCFIKSHVICLIVCSFCLVCTIKMIRTFHEKGHKVKNGESNNTFTYENQRRN